MVALDPFKEVRTFVAFKCNHFRSSLRNSPLFEKHMLDVMHVYICGFTARHKGSGWTSFLGITSDSHSHYIDM